MDRFTGSNDEPVRCVACGYEVSETVLWDRYGDADRPFEYPARVTCDACATPITSVEYAILAMAGWYGERFMPLMIDRYGYDSKHMRTVLSLWGRGLLKRYLGENMAYRLTDAGRAALKNAMPLGQLGQ